MKALVGANNQERALVDSGLIRDCEIFAIVRFQFYLIPCGPVLGPVADPVFSLQGHPYLHTGSRWQLGGTCQAIARSTGTFSTHTDNMSTGTQL